MISMMSRFSGLIGFATANPNKLREATSIAGSIASQNGPALSISSFVPKTDVEETGATLMENALIKLQAALAQGVPEDFTHVVAEDAGFVVNALSTAFGKEFPGVHARRWLDDTALQQRIFGTPKTDVSDAERNQGILSLMKGVADRTAAYLATLALWSRDTGKIETFTGTMPLLIIGDDEAPRGANGFAYDTIVKPQGSNQTVAELTAEAKNKISHRGLALDQVFQAILKRTPPEPARP